MGAILNKLPVSNVDNLETLSPKSADWLTSHADATGLAVVEVERLWNRFRQLTGSNDQTRLSIDGNSSAVELTNDVFVRNFIKHFPRSKRDPNSIPFGYFIMVMQWLDSSDVRTKLAAIFLYLNNGKDINVGMISSLLKHAYPETKEDGIKELAVQFMRQLGSNENGHLNQDQFISGVQRSIPPQELQQLLRFEIIPSQLLSDVDNLPSLPSPSTSSRRPNDTDTGDFISDNQLRQIAGQAARRDWESLAIKLGFLEYDIESFKVQNDSDPAATMYALLQTWREQDTSPSKKQRLRQSLQQTGFQDLVSLVK